MAKKKEIKGDGINTCKACGSADLFDGHFNAEGYAVSDGSGRWTAMCNTCGQDQNRSLKTRKTTKTPNLNSLINKALREQPKIKLLSGSRARVTTDHSEYILSYSFDRSGTPVVHSCVGVDRETCRGFRFHKVCSHGAALVIYLLDQSKRRAA